MSRSERPSDARSAERGAVGTAAGFRPPTARLRLGRPSDARSAERGEPMPARLRVRRRSLNAPRARRSLPCCLRRRRLQPADLPAAFERRPSDARSAERGNYLCSTPSSRDGVEGVFCVSEGARQSGDRAWRERAGPSPRPRVPISIWLANGAKVGTLLWLGTFIVWIVHGSATTFPNLITGTVPKLRFPKCGLANRRDGMRPLDTGGIPSVRIGRTE